MNGEQLHRKMTQVYGPDCIKLVADELEVDKSTVYRWLAAKEKVPGIVSSWIAAKIDLKKKAS